MSFLTHIRQKAEMFDHLNQMSRSPSNSFDFTDTYWLYLCLHKVLVNKAYHYNRWQAILRNMVFINKGHAYLPCTLKYLYSK